MRYLTLSLVVIAAYASTVSAQDLQPRAFSPAPVGLNTVLVGYALSTGNGFFDQALLIENAKGEVHGVTASYVRTFGMFGNLAKFSAVVPFAWGDWEGKLDGVPASTSRKGFADPRFQLAVNFVGAPAVTLKNFTTYSEGTIVGASVMAVVPLGQYDPAKLINLGSDRWAIRPRLGFSSRMRRLTLEAMADAWFFTRIAEAYGQTTITQAPVWALHGNVIYSLRNGVWLGVSGGIATGGRTTVNGVEKDNYQHNTRFAGTLAVPVNRRLSIRFFYINSVKTALGADFDIYNLSLQYTWGGGF